MLLDGRNPYREPPPERLALGRDDFAFALSAGNDAALGREAPWAVVAYLAADCDLAAQLFDDLLEMKRVGSSAAVHVSAWFNGPLLTDAFYARLNAGTPLGDDLVMRFGDLRFNQPKVLSMALQVAAAYPARQRVVFLGGHGAGWRGALLDENRSGHWLREPARLQLPAAWSDCLAALQACLRTAQDQVNRVFDGTPQGRREAVLAFDACEMGCLEAIAAFAGQAQILVVSQNQVAGDGYPYAQVLQDLQAEPGQTPRELARALVARTKRRYADEAADEPVVTQVALDSDALAAFIAAFVQLVQTLTSAERAFEAVCHAFAEVFTFEAEGNIDLVGFVQLLRERPLPDDTRIAANRVLAAWERALIASAVPGGAREMNGLSIHAPPAGRLEPEYLALMQDHASGLGAWARFLTAHHAEAVRRAGLPG